MTIPRSCRSSHSALDSRADSGGGIRRHAKLLLRKYGLDMGRIKSEYATIQPVPLRICAVSFADVRGIRHTVEVQAESLFEAAILGVRTFKGDPWIEHVGPATVLDIEVREPAAKHAITMMQVERWLEGASTSPNEGVKKAKLRDLLGSRRP